MHEKSKQLLELRKQFNSEGNYADKYQAITSFMQWSKLTGNYPALESAFRFMRCMNGEDILKELNDET